MSEASFSINPILNSPYEYPSRHWDMDADNQPTEKINEFRRPSSLKSPIAAVRRRKSAATQGDLFAESEDGVEYETNELINSIRAKVDEWRRMPPEKWGVTPETARLLKWWRNKDNFPDIRPFFCQVEAVETLIWLTEVANATVSGKQFLADGQCRAAWRQRQVHERLSHHDARHYDQGPLARFVAER